MTITTSILTRSRILATTFAVTALAFASGCTSEVTPATTTGDPGTGGSTTSTTGSGGAGGGAESCKAGESRACTSNGQPGEQDCFLDQGVATWGQCVVSSSQSTPLVLVFGDAPVEFVSSMAGAFDLTASGQCIESDWPSAATPWLALDRDGNGRIDGGAELFGSAVRLSSGGLANNGFEALAELDSNHDGRITPADADWSKLAIWSDRDGDRASVSSELAPLASRRLVSIELAYGRQKRCDDRGNCEIERATFEYMDASGTLRTGAIVDVHLTLR